MSRRVHLVGIGGTGMSAIARVLVERGENVSGSDRSPSEYSRALEEIGVAVTYGHAPENIAGADLVLISSAVASDNAEVIAARAAGIPIQRREAFFQELTSGQQVVAVAGTHGKSTTTGLIAWILEQAGMQPSFIVGGLLTDFAANARAGAGKPFVIEADEYDRAFLGLRPSIAVVTSVEHDHPDCYPTPESFQQAFHEFAGQVQDLLITCADDPGAARLQPARVEHWSYGIVQESDWRAEEIRPNSAGGSDFLVLHQKEVLGLARMRLPGDHNVLNALGALAVAQRLEVPFSVAREALTSYHGVGRRFEIVGQARGVTVIDDYAHHPTEIRATLAAARQRFPGGDVWAVFQPHTFSRTRTLLDDIAAAFADANHVVVTEIYASRETSDGTLQGRDVARRIRHADVRFAASLAEAAEMVGKEVGPGSVVVTLSAGDGNQVGRLLLARLHQPEEGGQHA
jgi:UDP-N-acetylmuramate--alanine ligase